MECRSNGIVHMGFQAITPVLPGPDLAQGMRCLAPGRANTPMRLGERYSKRSPEGVPNGLYREL